MTGHDAPARIEHADEVILLLLDEGRHRAPLHQKLHVANGRPQTPPDDLQRNRINRASLAPGGGEGAVRAETLVSSDEARAGLIRGRRCHRRSRRRFFAWSRRVQNPGATSKVASLCSMMAGPSKLMPEASESREWMGVSMNPRSRKYTSRFP